MTAPRIRYQTLEFNGLDIHLRTLKDLNQYADEDGLAAEAGISSANWPLFGVVWSSAEVLAHHMLDYQVQGLRILEVGCGIGLTSLLLSHRNADITATDHHPEAGPFLEANTVLNDLQAIPYRRTDWRDQESGLGRFDLIIGSDVLYEQGQAELLSGFIDRHANAGCDVIIVDPGRAEQSRFRKCMLTMGYSLSLSGPISTDYLMEPFGGRILSFNRPRFPESLRIPEC